MAIQPHYLGSMTLKALLEDPNLKNPAFSLQTSNQIKIKKEDSFNNSGGGGSSSSHGKTLLSVKEASLSQSGGSSTNNYGSAFLGANLWDKSYADIDFNLEYMDLDEFLSENGIDGEEVGGVKDQMMVGGGVSPAAHVSITDPVLVNTSYGSGLVNPNSPRQYLRTPPISPRQMTSGGSSDLPSPGGSYTPSTSGTSFIVNPRATKTPSPPVSPFRVDYQVSEQDLALSSIPVSSPGSPTTVCPVRVEFQVSQHDLAVSTAEGQDVSFDPRKRNFSEEELKPQPIIKKSKKVFVPEDCKDEKYWNRRHKNNFAAKRSRDARRVKENQIAMRAAYLEKENCCLRDEVNKLRKENAKLKNKVDVYENGESSSSSLPHSVTLLAPSPPAIIPEPSSPISVTSLAFS